MKAIITFHSIDDMQSVLSFHPDKFSAMVQSLATKGVPIVTLETLLHENTTHGICITFDDGMESVYTHALPVIKDYKIPAHLFLTTNSIAGKSDWSGQASSCLQYKMMNWQQVEACHAEGITIEAHTQSHPKLNRINAQQLEEECVGCDDLIEQRLGQKPDYFAYPFGIYDETAKEFAKSRYRASVTTFLGPLKGKQDLALLPRLDSYYLQPTWLHTHIDHPITEAYLMSRSLVRSIRKHQ